jgi:hypothetical protein
MAGLILIPGLLWALWVYKGKPEPATENAGVSS